VQTKRAGESTPLGARLLPKGDVLEQDLAARTEGRAERRNQRRDEAKHGAGRSRLGDNSSRILGRTGFWRGSTGLAALFSLFPMLYIGMGVLMLQGKFDGRNPPPPFFGWMLIGIGLVMMVVALGHAVPSRSQDGASRGCAIGPSSS
jgi:hypothetical protein